MIQTIDLRGTPVTEEAAARWLPRAEVDVAHAMEAARALVEEVRAEGEAALARQAERFDGVAPPQLRVPEDALDAAVQTLPAELADAIGLAIQRVRAATAAQVPPAAETVLADGARVLQRWQPVSRVGLYVPGGKAVYPSSVIMNVVPAQVAGVGSIALASPPQRAFSGSVHPTILAVARLLGVDEVYAMGGAGAIGALAYGVPSAGLRRVDVVTGPGNVYVAAAKRVVHGVVGIDAEAGPTEIVVIADSSADARLVAADLISQAEHDDQAASVLITTDASLAERVVAELAEQAGRTRHRERVSTALAGPQSAIVLVDDEAAAAAVSNAYGPEHLELQTADPDATLSLITNAGAIFLGRHAPVSLGDYLAGSNHVLPTGGQARFAAGLSAATFLRPQQIIDYDPAALDSVTDALVAFAQAEGLPAHGDAALARRLS